MSDCIPLRKRGRPRKYANSGEKKAADVKRKRLKRQEDADKKRTLHHDSLYNLGGDPVFPVLPPVQVQPGNPSDHTTQHHGLELPPVTSSIDEDCMFPNDLSSCLPPLSPPLGPLPDTVPDATVTAIPERQTNTTIDGNHSTNIVLDTNTIPSIAEHGEIEGTPHAFAEDCSEHTRQLADRLTDQLTQFHGCCVDCHQAAASEHHGRFGKHISLKEYLDGVAGLCPDILGSAKIASHGDDLIQQSNASNRRQIYTGFTASAPDSDPPHICLTIDERRQDSTGISFDIDSVAGFPTSIAVAKQGIRWKPTQMPVSDLQSSLHLRPRPVQFFDESGSPHTIHRPVHQIPHSTFGRLVGFEDISLYLLFPRLYRDNQQSSRLRDHDFRIWMDEILLPIIYRQYSSSHVQHYPSSYDHSRYNATARGVETLSQRVDPVAREQQLSYYIPPDCLAQVWDQILIATQEPGYHQFQDVTILLQAKNLKVLTKDENWESMAKRFNSYWTRAVDDQFVSSDFYFDVGMEICPKQSSLVSSCIGASGSMHEAAANPADAHHDLPAEVLLRKRCCLESYGSFMQEG